MDLPALQKYLRGMGDPLKLRADDANLPPEFRDFLSIVPNKEATLSPGEDGITLQGSTLTISGTSSDKWPVQGLGDVIASLEDIVFTISNGDNTPSIEGKAKAAFPLSPSVSTPVIITSLHQEANPWQILMAGNAEGVTPTQLLLLGGKTTLPFDIPSNLDVLSQILTVSKDKFRILFFPNTTYEVIYSFQLNAPAASWTLIDGNILAFNGIDIDAFMLSNSISLVLTGHILIDGLGVDVGVSLDMGSDWVAFIKPSKGEKFPSLIALAKWISGSGGSLDDDTSQGFQDLKLDRDAFDLALEAVTLGFNCKKTSLNYLEIKSLLTVGGIPLDVVLRLPEINIFGSLHDGDPVKVKDMLTSLGLAVDDVPDNLSITAVNFVALARDGFYSAQVTVDNLWQVGPVDLKEICAIISYSKIEGPSGQFNCQLNISEIITLYFEAEYAGQGIGWRFSGGNVQGDPIPIGEIINYIANKFNVSNLPKFIEDITLKDLAVSFSTTTKNFTFVVSGDIPVAQKNLDISVTISADSKAKEVKGKVTIGSAVFELDIDKSSAGTSFTAAWEEKSGGSLTFADIADALGLEPPEIPSEFELSLKAASFTYNSQEQIFFLSASSVNYGNAVLVAFKPKGVWQFFFGAAVGQTINLTNMPLIKSIASQDETVEIRDIQIVIASDEIDESAASKINELIGALKISVNESDSDFSQWSSCLESTDSTSYPTVPEKGMQKGIALSMVFSAGSFPTPLNLSLVSKAARAEGESPVSALAVLPEDLSDDPPTPTSDGTVWYNLQKTFGPISFQKVGIRYKDSILYVLMNASLGADGLNLSLLGFGFGSRLTIKEFKPKFNIDGLAISFVKDPVNISGGMIGTIDPLNFCGELTLGISNLTITALGGYTEINDHPSFFLYAVLDYPIGGPSFFFITGLAAGFGFNRKLIIPDINGVSTFPLVQWAMGENNPPDMEHGADIGKKVAGVLNTLISSGIVAPMLGEYWLAVGIRFTSFRVLDSFVLLTASFGTSFEVDLLGLSRLSLPPNSGTPVANVEMALKASFSPKEGNLSILGQLTPNSYVLSKDCHLTGGFAFCTWFSGDNAGDFVVTLGGYSSHFSTPSHYPQVPRLALNWNISKNLNIKGSIFFALTPTAVMAGGGFSAVWQSSHIKAWFDVETDFLMVFLPFHYYFSARIQLGASVCIFGTSTKRALTVHLGVGIEIWGPEFTGKAKIDLCLVSFTIKFGKGEKNKDKTITWNEFVDKLLPKAMPKAAAPDRSRIKNMRSALCRSAMNEEGKTSIVQITISKGLTKTLSEEEGAGILNYIVNAEGFEFSTQTAIPAKEFQNPNPFSSNIRLAGNGEQPNTDFGVGPTGTDHKKFSSIYTISIVPDDNQDSIFKAVRILSNVPRALWEKKIFDGNGVPKGIDLSNPTIKNVLVGYKISPDVHEPDRTLPIYEEKLKYSNDNTRDFEQIDPSTEESDNFSPDDTVSSTIDSYRAKSNRLWFLNVMNLSNLPGPKDIDVSNLANYDYLIMPPMLRLLGEQKA